MCLPLSPPLATGPARPRPRQTASTSSPHPLLLAHTQALASVHTYTHARTRTHACSPICSCPAPLLNLTPGIQTSFLPLRFLYSSFKGSSRAPSSGHPFPIARDHSDLPFPGNSYTTNPFDPDGRSQSDCMLSSPACLSCRCQLDGVLCEARTGLPRHSSAQTQDLVGPPPPLS